MAIAAACVLAITATASAANGGSDRQLRAALAHVAKQCPTYGKAVNRSVWQRGWTFNALYGDCLGNHDGRVWLFVHGRYVGLDSKHPSGEIISLWRDLNTIALLYVLYRPSDPMCCATGGGSVVRYRWTGKRVIRLDPLPPRIATRRRPSVPLARPA